MRAHDAWRDWRRQFNDLYFLTEAEVLSAEAIKAIDLPAGFPSPPRPEPVLTGLIARADQELPDAPNGGVPYPYSKGAPAAPAVYTNWLQSGAPPSVTPPAQDGYVVQYAVGLHDLEELDNEIRDLRVRLEKTRDYVTLQRQQLDSQTVALASLAGGVAGDGSGLQVARWLPFTKFTKSALLPEAPENGPQPAPDAAPPVQKFAAAAATFNAGVVTGTTAAFKQTLFTTALQQAPRTMSNIQFTLNADRLTRLTETAKQALTKPAFDAKVFRFGVLEHVLPEIQEYSKAYRGMRELLTTLDGMFDVAEAKSLKSQLEAFGKPKPPETLAAEDAQATGDTETKRQTAIQARYEALFAAGQILTKQIALMEGRYGRIESLLTGKLRDRVRREAELDKLAATIREATERLQNLDKRRIEFLGDYGVAQRLIDDDWRDIYEANEKRTRILTKGVRGLYYVRARQTPIGLPLADPLSLRHGAAGDIVPGCGLEEDPTTPEELDEFFDAAREIPMADWAALKGLKALLPPPPKLKAVYTLRDARFKARPAANIKTAPVNKLQTRLATLSVQTQSVLFYWSGLAAPALNGSHKVFQTDTAAVLSLEDILTGAQGPLRREAQQLRDRLEQCVSCMLNRLNELPPSIRLQWAQLAEDDRINVEQVNQWPGLERAERDDFNATRTVAELVAWWFRQLDKDAAGNSLSAMRNMIRAVLIFAALGDPAEILHGAVQAPPRRLAVGEPLRLKLNRAAVPGTVLQLLDTQQKPIALLNIEDQDAKGATAVITRVERVDLRVSTQFTVVASKMTKLLR
jgi:hypothetical protein